MPRSSEAALARRVNEAVRLLRKFSPSEAIEISARRYRVSRIQAYRYVREARRTKRILPIPEPKVVFTVKLPVSLVRRLRGLARSSQASLSDIVARALLTFLGRGVGG